MGYVSETSSRRSYLMDSNGREVTPSVKDQRIEEGRAKDNNEKRFRKKREGIHIVLEKIKPTEVVPAVVLQRTRLLEGVPVFDDNDSDEEMTNGLPATEHVNLANEGAEDEDEDGEEYPDEEMEE